MKAKSKKVAYVRGANRRTGRNTPPAAEVEVFTLAEAAAYLRVSEEDVLRMVREQELPARQIAAEWRFLKSALRTWLESPPRKSSKEALMAVAGKFKDDPVLAEMIKKNERRLGISR